MVYYLFTSKGPFTLTLYIPQVEASSFPIFKSEEKDQQKHNMETKHLVVFNFLVKLDGKRQAIKHVNIFSQGIA